MCERKLGIQLIKDLIKDSNVHAYKRKTNEFNMENGIFFYLMKIRARVEFVSKSVSIQKCSLTTIFN